jgi:hypothetical protein
MKLNPQTTLLARVAPLFVVALLGAAGCSSPTPAPSPATRPQAPAEAVVVEQPSKEEVEPVKVEPGEAAAPPPIAEAGLTVKLEVTPCAERSPSGEVAPSMVYDSRGQKLDLYDGVGHRWTLELASDKVSASKGDNAVRPFASLPVDKKGAKVCRGEVCKTLGLPKGADAELLFGALSPDATSGALLYHLKDAPEARPHLAIYSGSAWGKPTKLRELRDKVGDYLCASDLRWLSDGLIAVTLSVCAGPGASLFIYDTTSGALVATTSGAEEQPADVAVSAASYNAYGAEPVPLGGSRWLIYDSSGHGMVVFDAQKRTFGAPVSWEPRELAFDPGDVMVQAGPAPGQVMVMGRVSFGDVYVFDVATGEEVKRYVMCRDK